MAQSSRNRRLAHTFRVSRLGVALLLAGGLIAGCSTDHSGDSDAGASHGPGATSPGGSGVPNGGTPSASGDSSAVAGPTWNPSPASIASAGDSITRGFDACSLLRDCPEASWATGSKDGSLAQRLLSTPEGHTWNYAKSGARMADLPGQLASAARKKPELVTVLMGANDACRPSVDDMTPVSEYRADFTASLRSLRRELPHTEVYVASVPDLKRLWKTGREDRVRRQVWKLGICPSMLHDATATDPAATKRRQRVDDRVTAYNEVLREVCADDALCRFDDAVHAYRFDTDKLSKWDWFHPSEKGQRALADLAYRKVTAP